MRTILTWLLLAVLTRGAMAATYYVATNGNDANTGLAGAPWLTVTKAASVVDPGDVVQVGPGSYAGPTITRSGTAGSPIQFLGSAGAAVTSTDIRASYIQWRGFTHTNAVTWSSAVQIYGTNTGVVISGCSFSNLVSAYAVRFNPLSGAAPENGPSFCLVESNLFRRVFYINNTVYGVSNVLRKNFIRDTYGEGDAFRLWGRGQTISDNTVFNLGGGKEDSDGVMGGHIDFVQTFGKTGHESYGHIIERNIVADCKGQVAQLEQNGANIHSWTIRNNLFIDMLGAAACNLSNTWWVGNTFIRVAKVFGHAFSLSGTNSNRGIAFGSGVVNNAFIECGSNPSNTTYGWFSWGEGLDDLVVSNNFVCGPNGAAKRSDAGPRNARWIPAYGVNGGLPNLDVYGMPLAGSPLLDAGGTRAEYSTDILLTSRPVGAAWDVGMFERKSPQTPLTAWPFAAPELVDWGTNGVGSASNAPPSRRFRSTSMRVGLLTLATNANAAEGP